jgi:flagellar protein FliS
MYTHAYQQYRQTQIQTAGLRQLVLMLYEGGGRFLTEAAAAIEAGRIEQAHRALIRTQKIVEELIHSLNGETGELAGNLLLLYEYLYERLVQANLHKDVTIIAEASNLFQQLEDTWRQVLKSGVSEGGKGYGDNR